MKLFFVGKCFVNYVNKNIEFLIFAYLNNGMNKNKKNKKTKEYCCVYSY